MLSALAFSAGWSCLYSYYNAFGLGLFDLDLPAPATAMFAIRVLLHSAWPWIAFVLGLAGYGLLRRWLSFAARPVWLRDILVLAELVGAVILLALAGVGVGHRSARTDMNSATTELPAVAFISPLKVESHLPSCLVSNAFDCRILAHSKGFYFFFEPTAPDAQALNIIVYSIPDSQVQMVRLESGLK